MQSRYDPTNNHWVFYHCDIANAVTVTHSHIRTGFESEHHERALRNIPGVTFWKDLQRQRVGILTTNDIKHASCTLVNTMLRDNRIALMRDMYFVSKEADRLKKLLLSELEIYSYQWKSAATVFAKDRCSLSGKVGGMKDDLVVLLCLSCFWTSPR